MTLSAQCGQRGIPDCEGCPGSWPAREWPDPQRKGAYYTVPAKACSHVCHTRDVLAGRQRPIEDVPLPD